MWILTKSFAFNIFLDFLKLSYLFVTFPLIRWKRLKVILDQPKEALFSKQNKQTNKQTNKKTNIEQSENRNSNKIVQNSSKSESFPSFQTSNGIISILRLTSSGRKI